MDVTESHRYHPSKATRKGTSKPGLSASAPRLPGVHGIGRDGNVAAEANDCNPNGVMSRRGVLVRGGAPMPQPGGVGGWGREGVKKLWGE